MSIKVMSVVNYEHDKEEHEKTIKQKCEFMYVPHSDVSSDEDEFDEDEDEDEPEYSGVIPYHHAPKSMRRLAKSQPLPAISMSPDRSAVLILYYNKYMSAQDCAEPLLGLGGLRFNPNANGVTRRRHYYKMELFSLSDTTTVARELHGLPPECRLSYVRWSPNGKYAGFLVWSTPQTAHFGSIAFKQKQRELRQARRQRMKKKIVGVQPTLSAPELHQTSGHLYQLWVLDVASGECRRVTSLAMGMNMVFEKMPFVWLDESRMVGRIVSTTRSLTPPAPPTLPLPVIRENLKPGNVAKVRTNPDLLIDDHSIATFNYYLATQLCIFVLPNDIVTGNIQRNVMQSPGSGPIVKVSASPNAKYLLVETLCEPYSFTYTHERFSRRWEVYSVDDEFVHLLHTSPVYEKKYVCYDAVRPGPRDFRWASTYGARLWWKESIDGGADPAGSTLLYHDAVFMIDAPFTSQPLPLVVLSGRCGGVDRKGRRLEALGVRWGEASGEFYCIVQEMWRKTRMVRLWLVWVDTINAETGLPVAHIINERSYEDLRNDCGQPCMIPYPDTARQVVQTTRDGQRVLFKGVDVNGDDARPFLSVLELSTRVFHMVWRSPLHVHETVRRVWWDEESPSIWQFITEREDLVTPPNLYHSFVDVSMESQVVQERALTHIVHPFPRLKGVQRRTLKYTRSDGVPLRAEVYLPASWDDKEPKPLPSVLWAYPREFKSREFASHSTKSKDRFMRLDRVPLYFLCEGYVVLDGPSIPIIGEGTGEPNDTFITQLVSSVEAVIDVCVGMKFMDPSRVAVGGHSYGAFMAVNLLAHAPHLFACGIARSGAYNRTLTPFGFQREERTMWEATDLYVTMSPIVAAHNISSPLLLIHGERDENEGTHPQQSARMFHAMKGLGKVVRYVLLPNEGHSYRSYDTQMHVLYECTRWLNTYCKL